MARFDLNGKTVVITGASGGIGKETAVAFAKRGAKLVLNGRNLDALNQVEKLVKASGADAYVVTGDVTEESDMKNLVEKALEMTGRLDVMLLGAGFGVLGNVVNVPLELWRRQFEVNFFGVLNGFYSALPHFRKQGYGQFIIINSLSGRIAMPISSVYCASKFALWGFAESIREELLKDGIDLISVYPNFVKTKFQANIISPDYEVPGDLAWKMRGDSPEKIAELIVNASENRKGEVICTISGNLGARFLPMSFTVSRIFQKLSYNIIRRFLKEKSKVKR